MQARFYDGEVRQAVAATPVLRPRRRAPEGTAGSRRLGTGGGHQRCLMGRSLPARAQRVTVLAFTPESFPTSDGVRSGWDRGTLRCHPSWGSSPLAAMKTAVGAEPTRLDPRAKAVDLLVAASP